MFARYQSYCANSISESLGPRSPAYRRPRGAAPGVSNCPVTQRNVHERYNLGARYRWGVEASFLVEIHRGYHYEHAFALDWNAMKGYRYLMRMGGHRLNTLARSAGHLEALYAELGVRGAIASIRQSCAAP